MKHRKTEHPILMCGEMVRAILDGKKTETRRIIKPQPSKEWHRGIGVAENRNGELCISNSHGIFVSDLKCPYCQKIGDHLWVRETWAKAKSNFVHHTFYRADGEIQNGIQFPLSYHERENKWRPSLFMPRWASRITLTVKSVTPERLHEITDEGARAEGVSGRAEYESLWKQLNGEDSWAVNPWVWVVKFDVKGVRK